MWDNEHKEQAVKGGATEEIKGSGSGPKGCHNPKGTAYNTLLLRGAEYE